MDFMGMKIGKRASLLLASFAIFVVTVSVVAAGSGLPYPPHEEPGSAPNQINPLSLLSYSSDIMNLIALEEHGNVSALISDYNMTSLPANLQTIFSEYMSQAGTLDGNVQYIGALLNQTSNLLNISDLENANLTITQAGIAIGQAEILLSNIDSTTSAMGSSLGASTGAQGVAGFDAYSRQLSANQKVSDLINYYLSVLKGDDQKLAVMVSEGYSGNATTLTLESDVSQAWIGSNVELYGTLSVSASRSGLPGRNVTILMDGNAFGTAVTGASGNFTFSFALPAVYEDNATFEAIYTANGTDRGVYRISESQPLQIAVLYYAAYLTFNSPVTANPGSLVDLGGSLAFATPQAGGSTPSAAGETIQIYLGNNLTASALTGQDGSFAANFTVDRLASLGTFPLTASLSPAGVYGGANATNSLTIQTIPVKLTVSAPSFVFMPGTVTVSGHVTSSSIPLDNSTVTVTLGNSSETALAVNGTYTVRFNEPFSGWLAGFQKVSVNVVPPEPWYSTASAKASVFVLNSAFTAASVAAVGAVSFLYFRISRSNRKRGGDEFGASSAGPVIEAAPEAGNESKTGPARAPSVIGLNLGAASRRIADSYVKAARLIERKTGTRMERDMTMNEFLKMASSKVDGAANSLADLTLLAEKSLYSSEAPTQKDVAAAERCTVSLIEKLGK